MTGERLIQMVKTNWSRIGILLIIAGAAIVVWATRAEERPALAIAHLAFAEIESQLYAELKAIHGGEFCGEMENSTPDASGYSSKLAREHSDGAPSQRAIDLFEEWVHSFDQVDDVHIAGASVTFVSYAEDRDQESLITLSSGRQVHGNIAVMHALSGGAAGRDRWAFVHRASLWSCDPLE